MNESKHTPGPWVYDPDTSHYRDAPFLIWTSKGQGHGIVASASPICGTTGNFEENAANARLIAAAPELLACLQLALWRIENTVEAGKAHSKAALHQDISLIRAAIAKATGEAK